MGKHYDDAAAADYYSDPDARSVAGKTAIQRASALTTHVPVRFDSASVSALRHLAHVDGLTVSAWIRNVCRNEIERRMPSRTESSLEWEAQFDVDTIPETTTVHKLKTDSFAAA